MIGEKKRRASVYMLMMNKRRAPYCLFKNIFFILISLFRIRNLVFFVKWKILMLTCFLTVEVGRGLVS